jgi:hypothetical protein
MQHRASSIVPLYHPYLLIHSKLDLYETREMIRMISSIDETTNQAKQTKFCQSTPADCLPNPRHQSHVMAYVLPHKHSTLHPTSLITNGWLPILLPHPLCTKPSPLTKIRIIRHRTDITQIATPRKTRRRSTAASKQKSADRHRSLQMWSDAAV